LLDSLHQQLSTKLNPEQRLEDDSPYAIEWQACKDDPAHFIDSYCHLYDATAKDWVPFHLWQEQIDLVHTIDANDLVCVLKARQLGISWIGIAYALWLMLFHPVATVSIFSRREEEAVYLLGKERLKGMFERLPKWMQVPVEIDNVKLWQLQNGSIARAFPTTAGDSYTVSFAFVDEFDLVDNQGQLLTAMKPTVDGGGKMLVVSRSDSTRPQSEFKQIYRGGVSNTADSPWVSIFLPWWVRPGRTPEWYERQKREIMARTGSYDALHENYPATAAEALSGRTQDKRIPPAWLAKCYEEYPPLWTVDTEIDADTAAMLPAGMPVLPGLTVYELPIPGMEYVMGSDPAEGNSHSDPSSTHVVERYTGRECARLTGKFIPEIHALYSMRLSDWYNEAPILVERNNHGHAYILQCKNDGYITRLMQGPDKKEGWLTHVAAKTIMFDLILPYFREGDAVIRSFTTYTQLTQIEASTQRAPEGEHDDEAISYLLAQLARARYTPYSEPVAEPAVAYDQIDLTYRY
jgi:hypothetical protein